MMKIMAGDLINAKVFLIPNDKILTLVVKKAPDKKKSNLFLAYPVEFPNLSPFPHKCLFVDINEVIWVRPLLENHI
jgi:hypothetical protein